MKKWKALAAAMVIGCLACTSAGTLAYFTAEERAHNVITTGNIDIELVETRNETDENGNPLPFEDMKGVMPGTDASKIVQVKNTGNNDAFVRIRVDKAIRLADDAEGTADPELVGLDFNTEKWTLQGDYFYYNGVLAPGKTTEPLFTTVSFAGEMDNLYQGSSVSVDVTAYAVQADNNGSNALEAKGWPTDNGR